MAGKFHGVQEQVPHFLTGTSLPVCTCMAILYRSLGQFANSIQMPNFIHILAVRTYIHEYSDILVGVITVWLIFAAHPSSA